ncbi:MAG: SIMPL domain-containing protein [Pseudolabrys sp.]
MNRRIFALAFAAMVAFPVIAAADNPPPRIVVLGEGEATVTPDMALLSLAVMREAMSAREALTANNEAMTAVVAAMKALGIEARDLQTSGIQIAPRYDYVNKPDGTQEAKLAAYQVTNTISIRVRDIARTGEVIDQAVTLGVNQGGGISFVNEDPSATITEARKRAVADAIAKAKTLTEAAGVQIGRILEISEQSNAPAPAPFAFKALPEDASVPVEAGENSYRIQVSVTFELR